ncbi:MAG TPA: RDD family protein [Terriglobus sp.]
MLKRWRVERWFHAHETARFDALNGLPLASFKRRAGAFLLDGLIIGILKAPFQHFHFLPEVHSEVELLNQAAEKIPDLIKSVVYFGVALHLGKGQTPGKWLMKIKVLSLTEDSIGWWQSIERGLGYGASLLEGGFGFFQYFLNRNRMCVHDRIAETIVVDLRKPRVRPALHPEIDCDERKIEAVSAS